MMDLGKSEPRLMIFLHAMFPCLSSSFTQDVHVGRTWVEVFLSAGGPISLRGEHTIRTSHRHHVCQLWYLTLITNCS
jgi:hypothetical protein